MLSTPGDKNRRVLVIDDNRAIHDDFRKILSPSLATATALDATETALFGEPTAAVQQEQFVIESAYQGQEGVERVKQAIERGLPFALAFVDVRMPPGWDGVETTQKLWALDPDLQIVLCTAYSDYSWGDMYEKLGHPDGLLILKKPFDAVEALQLAHALTEKWSLHQQSRRRMEELESRVAERTGELQQSHKRLRDLIDGVGPSMFVGLMTPQGIVVEANRPALEAAGLKPEDVLGKPFEETPWWSYSPDVQERLRAAIAKAARGEASRYDAQVRGADDQLIDIDFSLQPLQDDTGKVAFIVPSASVISERKQMETALQESERRFSDMLRNLELVSIMLDRDGRITYCNDYLLRLTGWKREEVIGRNWFEVFLPPEIVEEVRVLTAELLADQPSAWHREYEILTRFGARRIIRWNNSVLRSATGDVIGTASIGEDITERKRAERQLAIQHEISRVLAESSTAEEAAPRMLQVVCETFGWDVSELWTVDSREGVLRCADIWSAAHAPMDEFKAATRQMTFGHNLGLPGRVWASGQPSWVADVAQDGDSPRALAAKDIGLHCAFAFPIVIGTGVSGVIECFSREAGAPDEELLHTFSVLGSQLGQFFQRRRLEDQLFQSQKLETVGKLAGGIAHEFNSILTAIIGQSELMLGELPAGSPLANNAIEISKAAGRAATLTRQLLAYGSKQFLQPETLDLNQVISSMTGIFDHLMGGGIVTHVVPTLGLQAVKADAGQIEQVIMNMAINARDAMPNGGQLTLETANVSLDQESVGRYPELKPGHYVLLAISDTGGGMSAEVQARIFEPFFTTKGVGEGTGLGLSTCYGIVKQSGGHISVYSELGRGTTFKIYLPQAEQQSKTSVQRLDAPDLPRGTETILLVEDDPALREMAATLLRRLGYRVLAAANGIEAMSLKQRLDTGHVDLLFTDVVMPHMSGSELADRVRASHPHTRILFTSAYTENAIVHLGVLGKGMALLQKPFTPSALARRIRNVLDEPGALNPDAVQETAGNALL